MRCMLVGRSWNRNRGEGFVLDSHGAARRGDRGPSPPKVEAAEMAGDIHDFANKEETGDFAGFHGFAVKFIGVHTADSDFGFFITFGSCRCDDSFVNLTLESFERLIVQLAGAWRSSQLTAKRLGRTPCNPERMAAILRTLPRRKAAVTSQPAVSKAGTREQKKYN